MTSQEQRLIARHVRRMWRAERQRRETELAGIVAFVQSLSEPSDAEQSYDGWLPQADRWRGEGEG